MAAVYSRCWRRWDCTKVNIEVQVACRVSMMIHWRRALAGCHNHEAHAPLDSNSIPNPQNAYRRLTLPSRYSIHLSTTWAHSRAQFYMLVCDIYGAGRACSLFPPLANERASSRKHLQVTCKSRRGEKWILRQRVRVVVLAIHVHVHA